MIHEQAKALLDPTPKMQIEKGETNEISFPNTSSSTAMLLIIDNKEEETKEHLEQVEHWEQIEPPNLSNDKEVSTEAHSFIIIPLETQHEPQA